MAILISRDGRFYDIPDSELSGLEIPAEKLEDVLSEMDPGGTDGGVQPYGWKDCAPRHRWRNNWRNCWRNCY